MSEENPWKVGAAVIPYRIAFDGTEIWGRELTIEKVYKSGNVVVAGQQYRAFPGDAYAISTGSWNPAKIYLATAETRARANTAREAEAAERRGRAIVKTLDDRRLTESIGRHGDEFDALIAKVKATAGMTE